MLEETRLRPVRGVVTRPPPGPFLHHRRAPAATLLPYVEHLWCVQWQVPEGMEHRVATVPHPCVHWTFEAGSSTLTGPHSRLWQRSLRGTGEVLGIKFRPEGFRRLWGRPLRSLRDQILRDAHALPELRCAAALPAVLGAANGDDPGARLARIEHLLAGVLPAPCALQMQVARWIDVARAAPDDLRVDTWARTVGTGPRQLQRMLADWVGVHPKWLLNRYRLHTSLHRLQASPPPRLADLAADAGYADAAHFSRSFRALLGCSPQDYARLWQAHR